MHEVEKLGHLILVTLEGQVDNNEIASIKLQLRNLKHQDDEVVVSLNLSQPDGSKLPVREEMQKRYNEIAEFCNQENIRLYSYVNE
jgi:hypothetical protein